MATSSEEDDEIDETEEDYYTFLNISKEATPDEIKNAYRRLSRLYHPDKHIDPVKKKQAETLFGKTKRAYEVISDPHSRAIYDNLGTKGLETEGWEIVQRTKTPQEIREEYERLARDREERKLQQKTNPKGVISVSVNATELFESYDISVDDPRSLPQVEISGMTISQSIEAPLTLNDTVTLGGQLSTHNGTGSGTISCAWRRILSARSWVECDVGAGNGPVCSVRFFRTLSKRSFVNMAGIFQFTPQGLRPGLQAGIGRQLDKHTMGYLTWKAGMQSSMNSTLVWDTLSGHLAFSLQFGIPHSFAVLSYTHKFPEDTKVKGSAKFGTFGMLFEYACETRVSQHSILGAAMVIGVPMGITLKIKKVSLKLRINRGNQNYAFPIFLSENLLPAPIFYGTVVPLLTYYSIKTLIVTPYLKHQKQRDAEKQREASASKVLEKRREAETAVSLMAETYHRVKEQEEAKRGLVVVRAVYGRLLGSDGDSFTAINGSASDVLDVTVQLQCLVKDSKLILHEFSKMQLPGFFDPCVGQDKSLYVQYKFHGLLHEVTINDNDLLRIPKQSHRVDS